MNINSMIALLYSLPDTIFVWLIYLVKSRVRNTADMHIGDIPSSYHFEKNTPHRGSTVFLAQTEPRNSTSHRIYQFLNKFQRHFTVMASSWMKSTYAHDFGTGLGKPSNNIKHIVSVPHAFPLISIPYVLLWFLWPEGELLYCCLLDFKSEHFNREKDNFMQSWTRVKWQNFLF